MQGYLLIFSLFLLHPSTDIKDGRIIGSRSYGSLLKRQEWNSFFHLILPRWEFVFGDRLFHIRSILRTIIEHRYFFHLTWNRWQLGAPFIKSLGIGNQILRFISRWGEISWTFQILLCQFLGYNLLETLLMRECLYSLTPNSFNLLTYLLLSLILLKKNKKFLGIFLDDVWNWQMFRFCLIERILVLFGDVLSWVDVILASLLDLIS